MNTGIKHLEESLPNIRSLESKPANDYIINTMLEGPLKGEPSDDIALITIEL